MNSDNFREVNIKDYFRIIGNRKPIFFVFFITTVFLVILQTYTATPLYKATTEILLEENDEVTLLGGNRGGYNPIDPTFLKTQYEIMRSKGVTDKIIETLNLDTKYKVHFLDDENAEPSLKKTIKKKLSATKNQVKSFIKSLLPSKKKQEQSSANGDDIKEKSAKDIISDILSKNIQIAPIDSTKIVRIHYTHTSPKIAAMVANAIPQAYRDELMEIKNATDNYSLEWMSRKAKEEQENLTRLEAAKQQYARDNDIVTVENRLAVIPQKLTQIGTRLAVSETRQRELEVLYKQIQIAGDEIKNIESFSFLANHPELQNLRTQLLTADRRIGELSKKYGPKHPRMVEAKNERQVLLREKKTIIKSIIQNSISEFELAQASQKELQKSLVESKREALVLNERFEQYKKLEQEIEASRLLYDSLSNKMKEQSATNMDQAINVWPVKEAIAPEGPDTPNKKLNLLLGLVLGSLGGVGCVFITEYLDDTIKTPDDMESRFNIPILGVVENVPEKKKKKELRITEKSISTISESYKIIRSSVLLSSANKPPRTLLLTSPEPGDGKTTTSVNFAATLSMLENSQVLLIDCDLRRPTVHKHFSLKNDSGLSSYLAGIVPSTKEIITKRGKHNLAVITSGPAPPNPSELLNSARMKSMLAELSQQYRFIVLDSPPIMGAIDTLDLSSIVDGTIVVVRANKTTKDIFSRIIKRMSSVNTHILGTILNGAEIKSSNAYQYSGYYGSYHNEELKKS